MQTVAAWLQNGTYEQGVLLYEQHGSNSFLKQKFATGPNDYNVAKLREELLKIRGEDSGSGGEREQTAFLQKPETPNPATPPATPTPENAKRYLQITKQRNKLYLELNMLMEQKHYLPDGEELRLCAAGILTKHQKITELWALIDYYQEHQCFPDDEVEAKPKPPLKKEMQLLRQTISKAKKRLESPTCRDKVQTESLLAISRNKLAQLVAIAKNKPHE
ncbi:hypothetical protein GCM10023149_30850 [Mucilaginibacter gynuensis]|uniref:Uncharacterized protein n=1 Tax=Mucilaginibacter gynuensis TaxID=1302236 RepID=A0ABP8GNT1_9SPHI